MPYPMTVIEFTPENIRLISGYVKEEKIYLTKALEGEDLTDKFTIGLEVVLNTANLTAVFTVAA